jgi:hypothetical protein
VLILFWKLWCGSEPRERLFGGLAPWPHLAVVSELSTFFNNHELREANEVQLNECKHTCKIANKVYSTEVLAIFCLWDTMYMTMDLISKLFPGTPKDEFDDDPVIKSVPFSTPYDQSAEHTYVSLIQEQNQFLQHVGIPVRGLSYKAMARSPENDMALDSTLYYTKLFMAL